MSRSGLLAAALLVGVCLVGACIAPQGAAPRSLESLVVSPLGTVVVGPGEEIHIRTASALTRIGDLDASTQRAVALAIADYGPIKGHAVTMGAGLDSQCTPEGGAAAADTISGDRRVVGVIGPTCSAAGVVASPILSAAGLTLISPTNTAPTLTSDLRGTAGPDNHPGYYRTASNDLYEAEAVASFSYHDLGLRVVAVLDDGDPYTTGLAGAFTAAFAELGGAVVAASVSKGQSDMAAVLGELAKGRPDGLFMPLFPVETRHILEQYGQVAGMDDVTLIGGSGLLELAILSLPQSEGMYFASPEVGFGGRVNEATGRSGADLAAAYAARYNEAPRSVFMAHAYDAATLLLRAIEETALAVDDRLYIDRARLREALSATQGFDGIIGTLSCDAYGDCGTGHLHIVHHTDSRIEDLNRLPVVYQHRPEERGGGGH